MDAASYFCCPSIRDGKNNMARNSAKTASKVIPINRKGMDMSHINGQSISASKARGQQITHNNNQHIKVSI
jgi:hypothetical protein